jgi:hypothetical protein
LGVIGRDVHQAEPSELPIERGLAGPALLAGSIVRRWYDHLPPHRLERIYGRDGRSRARRFVTGTCLCTDATGVLVQAEKTCRTGHVFVVAVRSVTCFSANRPSTTPPQSTNC